MYHSRTIKIGMLEMGGESPVVIQSMTSTDTNDINGSVEQCIRIFDAGADMVRLTTQSIREVLSLRAIRDELRSRGYNQPLVADVHFQPKVAEEAAKIVEKVRINPGNYVNRKYSGPQKFSILEQKKQLEIIRERLLPLIRICNEHNTAIRVGVNHGSLSERMMNWYGNTAEGMVESALEFIRIFEEEKFHNLVISLKASNTRMMIHANRLLAKKMYDEGFYYPIHLGVTEAGDEEDGRIKSALGIGTLLADGIGDTIRVSLTEDPEKEVPVGLLIRDYFANRKNSPDFILKNDLFFHPFEFKRRISLPIEHIGGKYNPVVFTGSGDKDLDDTGLKAAGYEPGADNINLAGMQASDFIYVGSSGINTGELKGVKLLQDFKHWKENPGKQRTFFPLIPWKEYGISLNEIEGVHFIHVEDTDTPDKFYEILEGDVFGVLILSINHSDPVHHTRNLFRMLGRLSVLFPVILHKKYNSSSRDELMVRASVELGSLINDGLGDGLWIEEENTSITGKDVREISFSILQATGTRISKTEYISCPSCGRTLFDIQSTLKKIKHATSGFTGLKIGVMGCIVNGPGEMADADFGYVGAGPGLVTLYKGREAVKKNIPEANAVDELVDLIRENMRI